MSMITTDKQHPREESWKEIITPANSIFSINLKELWEYRDLLFILSKRDVIAIYKQTILGPLWFFLQPALTTFIYFLVFTRAGRLSTGGLPPALFYISGLVLWIYFSECVLKTSAFIRDNSAILSKVYFPRLIIPLSIVISNLVKLSIQLLLFVIVYAFYLWISDDIAANLYALLIPVLISLVALFGLGSGILVASLTNRYKDLVHLINFGVQLLMFASTVIFPIDAIQDPAIKRFIQLNPISGIIEAFRFGLTGKGYFNWSLLIYDAGVIVLLVIAGIVVFNSIEKKMVDSI